MKATCPCGATLEIPEPAKPWGDGFRKNIESYREKVARERFRPAWLQFFDSHRACRSTERRDGEGSKDNG